MIFWNSCNLIPRRSSSYRVQTALNDFVKHILLIENVNFRRLFGAGICSNLADGLMLVALPWLATLMTDDPFLILHQIDCLGCSFPFRLVFWRICLIAAFWLVAWMFRVLW